MDTVTIAHCKTLTDLKLTAELIMNITIINLCHQKSTKEELPNHWAIKHYGVAHPASHYFILELPTHRPVLPLKNTDMPHLLLGPSYI